LAASAAIIFVAMSARGRALEEISATGLMIIDKEGKTVIDIGTGAGRPVMGFRDQMANRESYLDLLTMALTQQYHSPTQKDESVSQ
jgi:hypothetical protein